MPPCCSSRCSACSPTRGPTRSISNFAGQWLHLRNVETATPDPVIFPFDEALRASFIKETELFVAQHHPRGSQPARSADGRLHVRQRAARRALRHSEGLRFAVPARDADRSESARPARQGQHPDGDVVSQSHVGRAARQVDSREPARHAAAAAAGRCAGAGGESERRQGALAARADGAASVERGLRGVPRAHGSDRVRARELRRRREVAR